MKKRDQRNIILIGMSGAGKSTLGVLLAKALGMDFVDTDIMIQQQEKRLLQEIIDADGIEAFMKIEEDVIVGMEIRHSVVATGGSVVYSQRAMDALKRGGTVIYLSVPYEEVQKRVTNITTRGIVLKAGNSLQDAYEERRPLYERYSDIIVDCANLDIEQCVREMVEKLTEDAETQ